MSGLSLVGLVNVNPNTLCWEWLGRLNPSGYAIGHVPGVQGGSALIHRYVYETLERPVPEGLELDHVCGRTNCVNPDHLEPVTHLENIRRAIAQGRGVAVSRLAKTHCDRGHPYDEANTYLWRGVRHCRACRREASRASKQRGRN